MERRKYDREFKKRVVEMCEQKQAAISQIARDFGLNRKMVHRWIEEARQAGAEVFPGKGHSPDDEVKRLRRELARVEMGP